jgi:hypothetical protein
MSRFKLVVLGMLAVLAVSAAAAATASAATSLETRYFVEGTELTSAETVDGVVGVAQLNSTVSGAKIMIECTANEMVPTGNNTIEGGGVSHTEISYKQCYLYTISKGTRELSTTCRVKEPITFKAIDQLFAGNGGLVEDEFKPSAGTIFVEIEIVKIPGKTCLLEKTYKAEGTYIASFGDEGERQMTEHELVFNSTGSKVTFEKEPASYTNTITRLKLRNNKMFY